MKYLLDIQMESTTLIAFALVAIGISMAIYYFVIKAAVSAANKDLLEQLKAANALKVLELRKQGHDTEALREAGGYYQETTRIEKRKPYITNEEYSNEKKRLDQIFQ